MREKTWFDEKLTQFADDPVFLTEEKILEFTEKLVLKMEEYQVSRSELAKRLGVSKAMVTKLLNGNPNMTVKTMVTVAHALGCELGLDLFPKGFKVPRLYLYEKLAYSEPVLPTTVGEQNAAAA